MSFMKLKSGTRFSAHQELCELVESNGDTVIDFSFRGRNNYFLMQGEDEASKYILYAFLICPDDAGWVVKLVNEFEHIPNYDCPERLLRGSNVKNETAVAWRNQVKQHWEMQALERLSNTHEHSVTCLCRYKSEEQLAELNVLIEQNEKMKANESTALTPDLSYDEELPF